ncbi:MAG: CehA/McbA family metallohydrolase [Thermoplasmata archaeon]
MRNKVVYVQAHCHSRYSINKLSGEGVFHRVIWPVERQIMRLLMKSPGQLAKLARKNNVQFVVVTDHNTIPKVSGDLLIPGEEWGQTKGHANFINLKGGIDPECGFFRRHQPLEPKDFMAAAAEARRQGAFVSINHPFKRDAWLWGEESYGLADAIEIWNGRWNEENSRALAQWQNLLVKGNRIFCMAGNDFHVNRLFDIGSQVLVFRNVSDRDSVLRNLASGNFSIARDTRSAAVFLAGDLSYEIENYSEGLELRIISPNSSLSKINPEKEGSVRLENAEKFLRLELWKDGEPLSFTNPIFL